MTRIKFEIIPLDEQEFHESTFGTTKFRELLYWNNFFVKISELSGEAE